VVISGKLYGNYAERLQLIFRCCRHFIWEISERRKLIEIKVFVVVSLIINRFVVIINGFSVIFYKASSTLY
jgi:hypothetical protein